MRYHDKVLESRTRSSADGAIRGCISMTPASKLLVTEGINRFWAVLSEVPHALAECTT